MTNGPAPRRVVLGPDLIVSGLFEPNARQILNDWRDGRIQPVLNRELLLIYLRLLRSVGLDEKLLADWAAWLTNPEKVHFLPDNPRERDTSANNSAAQVCAMVAAAAGCEILSSKPADL